MCREIFVSWPFYGQALEGNAGRAKMCKLRVDPGICGFECEVDVIKQDKRTSIVKIKSECDQILKFNEILHSIELRDIFVSPVKNVVFKLAQKAGCHASCPVPIAVLKCAEVEMGMALPRNVVMNFGS
jgi:hypothetical protein